MNVNIDRKNDFDKVALTMEVPRALHEAFSELAGFCRDTLEADHPGADFARVEEEAVEAVYGFGRTLMAKVIESRDDGARSIQRDGRSLYRLSPSRGILYCFFGKVEYWRSLYRSSTSGNSICPTDESLALLAGRMTCPAGKMATRLLADIRCNEDISEGAESVVLSLDGVHVLLRPGERPIGIAGDDDAGPLPFLTARGNPCTRPVRAGCRNI